MTNTCFPHGDFHLTTDDENGPRDRYGVYWNQNIEWIEHVAEILRSDLCNVKTELGAAVATKASTEDLAATQTTLAALQTAVADLQVAVATLQGTSPTAATP